MRITIDINGNTVGKFFLGAFLCLMVSFFVFLISLAIYNAVVINSDIARTYDNKEGWLLNYEGKFFKETDCWGQNRFYVGDRQLKSYDSWLRMKENRDSEEIRIDNLQSDTNYRVYVKHYTSLFGIPWDKEYIESCEVNK